MRQIRVLEEQAEKSCNAGKNHGTIIWIFVPSIGKRFGLFGFRIMKDKPVYV